MSETAKVRNKSKADLYVPCLGVVVEADEVVDVPVGLLDGFKSGLWSVESAPKQEPAAKKAASKG